MALPPYYPYRSAQAKSEYLASYDRIADDWPAPAESRMISTSWGETLVRINGPASAPPLVLLPGINTSSLLWQPNIPVLSARYRTYAVDRAGDIGRSTCTRPMANLNDILSWLDELLTALDPANPVRLVGCGRW